MTVLITGGAGYIGSHACVEFLNSGHDIVVLDNFCASSRSSLDRVEKIAGARIKLVEGDIRDRSLVESTIRRFDIKSVIHFAGLKAVGDSGIDPLEYYNVNVVGSERLLSAMKNTGVFKIVFSSSATVYGIPKILPVPESHNLRVTNPYGRTKLMIEDMLRDLVKSDQRWSVGILRYFNPVGAHPSGLIGEDPLGTPMNLMPIITQVAAGKRNQVSIFGDDYDTPDGTGVRDFIHVVDLAKGHVSAHAKLDVPGCFAVNLGTGRGYSVLEMIHEMEHVTNRRVPYEFCDRREGDVASCYADTEYSAKFLNWRAQLGLRDMCRDTWNWVSKNPNGYGGGNSGQASFPGMETPDQPVGSKPIRRRIRDWV